MSNPPEGVEQKNAMPKSRYRLTRRFGPLILLLAMLGGFFALGLNRLLTLDQLALNYAGLSRFVAENTAVGVLIMIIVYLVAVATSFSAAGIITPQMLIAFSLSVLVSMLPVLVKQLVNK